MNVVAAAVDRLCGSCRSNYEKVPGGIIRDINKCTQGRGPGAGYAGQAGWGPPRSDAMGNPYQAKHRREFLGALC